MNDAPRTNRRARARTFMDDHIDQIERTGDTRSVSFDGMQIVLLRIPTARGELKIPLMRVEHEGVYAAVASKGGGPDNPRWYDALVAHPDITLQDGTEARPVRARELSGTERDEWWTRSVAGFPPYATYQTTTDRRIPVLVLEPR